MKQAATALFLSLLFLVSCTVEAALPTSVPVAQAPTNTAKPPATTTSTPISTSTPTVTPTRPFPTFTPVPTQRPTSVPDAIDPSLPPPTGQIFMIWDPDPPKYIDGELKGSFNYNFYRLTPGTTPTLDSIDVSPAYLFNAPYVLNVSPDQKKIALILLDDTNGNGQFDSHGYDTDDQTIHLYDVASNTLVPFVAGEHSIFSLSWLPDSQALLYAQGEDVFLSKLDGSPAEVLLNIPGAHINQVSLSPDGEWLVLYGGNPAPQIFAFELGTNNIIMADNTQFRDMRKPQWSADSGLLAFGQHGTNIFRPLSLFDSVTLEFTVSVASEDDIVSIPSWASGGQWLAFTTNQMVLSLWNRDSLTITEILTGTFVSPPIWSPIDNHLAVGLIKDGEGKLLTIDVDSGDIKEWYIGSDIQEVRVLSWSPNGNWIAFIAVGTGDSDLYIAPKQEEKVYLMLDLMEGEAVGEFAWLPVP